MPTQNDIRKMTGIQDKQITFNDPVIKEGRVKGKKAYILQAKLTYTPKACEQCGAVNHDHTVIKNGTQPSTIRLPNRVHGLQYLKLKKQRFLCKSCGESFVAKTSVVQRNCFISNLVKAEVASEATEAVAIKYIAQRVGVSWHTVQRLIHRAAKEAKPFSHSLPEHLSFDEFKYRNGRLAFHYIDAVRGRILGTFPGTTQKILWNHFVSHYSRKERSRVKTITIDMNSAYFAMIERLFPNAKVVIDRFHIVQLLNRAFNKTRIRLMNQLRSNASDQKKYRRLKRHWRLFLKKEGTIRYTSYTYDRLFGWRTELGRLDEMLDYDGAFRADYKLFQSLQKMIQDNDEEGFQAILNQDPPDCSPYLITCLKTLRKYQAYIKNTFIYPYNNGRIEGIHHKIKVLNRVAYGHRNFGNFLNRIILNFNLKAGV